MGELRLRNLHAGSAVYLPGDTFGPRTLTDYELVLITQGSVRYFADEVEHAARAGTFILARPGFRERYVWDPAQTTRHLFFHFSMDQRPGDWPLPERWPITRDIAAHGPMPALMDYVVWLIEQQSLYDSSQTQIARQVEALLSLFLLDATGGAGRVDETGPLMPVPVMRAMDWARRQLRSDPSTAMDLDALARAASINPRHLCRLFSEALQTTPMRWVQQQRLAQARTLLRRSNLNVNQIADRCGFASPFHFSRAYKNRYGKPPSADRLDA